MVGAPADVVPIVGAPADVVDPDAVAAGAVELPECWDCWKHATSYCEFAPAALYAFPPVPPLGLLIPGSLNGAPGELAELPGRVVAENDWQDWLGCPVGLGLLGVLWGLSASATPAGDSATSALTRQGK